MMNTFGPAILCYNEKEIANSEEPTKHPVGTLDFKFLVRVNDNGTFDIQRKEGVCFNVTIEENMKVCQIQVRNQEVAIPPWYTLSGDVLRQHFSTRPLEFGENHFRLRLLRQNIFRRVDVRFLQSSWATTLISNNKLMGMYLNGNREVGILESACVMVADRVKRGVNIESGSKLGLSNERILQRTENDSRSSRSTGTTSGNTTPRDRQTIGHTPIQSTSQATTSNVFEPQVARVQTPIEEMPKLIDMRSANKIREEYIQQLEMALAAIKTPRLERNKNPTE